MKSLKFIWYRLTAPNATHPDQARQEFLTKAVLVMMGVTLYLFTLIIILVDWLIASLTLESILIILLADLITTLAWWFANRGFWRASSYVPALLLFALGIYGSYTVGLVTTLLLLYALAIMLSGWLHGKRTQWVVMLLSLVVHLAVSLSRFPEPIESFFPVVITLSGAFTGLSLLQSFYTNQLGSALYQARTYATYLADVNLVLEDEVAERKLTTVALRREKERAQKYLQVADVILLAINRQEEITLINDKGCRVLGYTEDEIIGRNWFDTCIPPAIRSQVRDVFHQLMAGEIELVEYNENVVLTKSGEERLIAWHNTVLTDEFGEVTAALGSGEDITNRKRVEERIQRQLLRLNTLRHIDQTITARLDLPDALDIILEKVVDQLRVHAAAILLLEPNAHTLEFTAGHGFLIEEVHASKSCSAHMCARHAGQATQCIRFPDLSLIDNQQARCPRLSAENAQAYFAVPLIVNDRVKGVLEVIHRTPLEPDKEWIDFLETLAGQAAIAVDNAQLLVGLRQSKDALLMAYDATLEGWARALELRDQETKGHSQRVTELSLRLAKELGIEEEQMVHIYRGALLHDIGKMAIPDEILHKPGSLDQNEWEIMKLHPIYAYQMLSSIDFLGPAIDIPHYHHERWDGTGYPRGLEGDQIPLPARIFSVVDVYDALLSDRPYRRALPRHKVLDYIRQQAGKHFDPQVVTVFLQMISSEEILPGPGICDAQMVDHSN